MKLSLEEKYGWQLGGKFPSMVNSIGNSLGIYRLVENHLLNGGQKIKLAHNNIKNAKDYTVHKSLAKTIRNNILFLRAIDSKNGKKIKLEDIRIHKVRGLIGKNTSRNMAYLLFKKKYRFKNTKKNNILF